MIQNGFERNHFAGKAVNPDFSTYMELVYTCTTQTLIEMNNGTTQPNKRRGGEGITS